MLLMFAEPAGAVWSMSLFGGPFNKRLGGLSRCVLVSGPTDQ